MDKRGKQVSARITNYETWDRFTEMVNTKHGSTFGNTGKELEKAILFYLEHPNSSDISSKEESYKLQLQDLEDRISKLNQDLEIKTNENIQLNQEIETLKTERNKALNDYDILNNDFRHLNELFKKTLKEKDDMKDIKHDMEISFIKFDGLPWYKRLFKMYDNEYKALMSGKEKEEK